MPKVSKQDILDVLAAEGYEGRFAELDGYTVGFETYTADSDMAPLFSRASRTTGASAPTGAWC